MDKFKFKRIFVIVADSVGCGYDKESYRFNDEGANTLKHISENVPGGLNIPNLNKLGIGDLTEIVGTNKVNHPHSFSMRLNEMSNGKDTLTGHWEIMGLNVTTPFPSYDETHFPQDLIDKIEELSGRKVIGNIPASGTEIIKDMGMEQIKTGALIAYTSTDSVLQIAAHEEIIPIEELYDICSKVRKICSENPKWMVGRIIARPYIGTDPSNFTRTPRRHDYAVSPFGKTTLDFLKEAKYEVISVGKIYDIFNGNGLTESNKIVSNHDGMLKTMEIMKRDFTGLCFVNLVDFDSMYGHRRDIDGYAKADAYAAFSSGQYSPRARNSQRESRLHCQGFLPRFVDRDLARWNRYISRRQRRRALRRTGAEDCDSACHGEGY